MSLPYTIVDISDATILKQGETIEVMRGDGPGCRDIVRIPPRMRFTITVECEELPKRDGLELRLLNALGGA